ncbi:Protein of unknown function (DUF1329) [Acidovorax sp. CF316]|uniref:DUF1329 domain-containing protein n=1 Tax=Acidovorax sp. CF316 TaxID=1144317 RepID=UPI00026BE556|nr:DUF1329 domain-containing protein [Acidovorax sp. CF316]EJE50519.1 Protein of unknown function (DUF1329) [Acidovorax sp. CF316]
MHFPSLNRAGAMATASMAAALLLTGAAMAAPEDVAALKSGPLTPYGAERAGNKDGTIPAWDGKAPPASGSATTKRADPFAADKPRLTITAANAGEHAAALTDGTKALLAKVPGFKLDVYPTRRSAVFPQAIYDQVLKNASRSKLANDGLTVEGSYGGIPFPVPKNGHEAIWNHMLSYRGQVTSFVADKYVMTSAGDQVLTSRQRTNLIYPFYDPAGSPEQFSGEWARARIDITEPPANAGQALMTIDYVDNFGKPKDGWQYLPGQRRVRKSPSIAYDTPDGSAAGLANFDDVNLFIGSQDRYQMKLLGKREIIVPYNNNALMAKPVKEVVGKGALNPDAVRWELHRVWVVEATLRDGKRNTAAKRRFYLDEDTWQAVLADSWDAQGKLWKTGQAFTLVAGDQPLATTLSYAWFDLLSGGWVFAGAVNETGGVSYRPFDAKQLNNFTSSALASGGVR